jgi:hypothetical protein
MWYDCLMITLPTKLLLITFATLAALHILAIKLSLYWHFWWFDIPMHFFGGVIVALGVYVVRDLGLPLPSFSYRLVPFLCIVLLVALIWEAFELWAGVPMESDFIVDSATDLLMGMMGGYFGYHLGRALAAL